MKKSLLVLLIGLFAVFMVACGSDKNEDTDKQDDDTAAETDSGDDAADSEEEAGTLTITHELGETEVPKNPEKVVVFDFGILDTMDKLGIDVTGVAQSNIPSYLEKYESDEYENIGSLKEPDFEKIAEIDPDLIIISGRQSSLYDQLEELAPTIFLGVDTARYMDSFKENTEIVGQIFDKEDEVEQALADVDEKVEAISKKAEESGKNGLIILANDDKISAYGPSSRFGIIHDVFGVPAADEGIEVSTHGQNVSFEYIVEQDPDLLYVVDRSAAIGEESAAKNVVENKLMEKTKAKQNDDIVYLNPDVWYLSGGGLISVNEMMDEIDKSLD